MDEKIIVTIKGQWSGYQLTSLKNDIYLAIKRIFFDYGLEYDDLEVDVTFKED